jgi:hypothetical protein
MNELMETAVVGEREGAMRVAVNGDAPGRLVEIVRAGDAPGAVNGLGTVHHVAFAVDDPEQQLEMRRELLRRGVQVTDVMDRQYFKSIYFREPGGVLFEVATIPPGFTADESVPELGKSLKLRRGRNRTDRTSRPDCRWSRRRDDLDPPHGEQSLALAGRSDWRGTRAAIMVHGRAQDLPTSSTSFH